MKSQKDEGIDRWLAVLTCFVLMFVNGEQGTRQADLSCFNQLLDELDQQTNFRVLYAEIKHSDWL